MAEPCIEVKALTIGYGTRIVQRDLNFHIARGDIFIIMGGSGCGKSTLLRHLIGLQRPLRGDVFFEGQNFWQASPLQQQKMQRRIGVLFQNGGLLSSLTLAENVALPLREFTALDDKAIETVVAYQLALVGLAGFEQLYPAELSGGMQKRAGLARAMALNPDILFFDEPSAGLDPVSARLLDDLILNLRDKLGATIVVVTHELASIFAIGTQSVFLDAESQTMIATGPPKVLLETSDDPRVRRFLTRGEAM